MYIVLTISITFSFSIFSFECFWLSISGDYVSWQHCKNRYALNVTRFFDFLTSRYFPLTPNSDIFCYKPFMITFWSINYLEWFGSTIFLLLPISLNSIRYYFLLCQQKNWFEFCSSIAATAELHLFNFPFQLFFLLLLLLVFLPNLSQFIHLCTNQMVCDLKCVPIWCLKSKPIYLSTKL